jgi:tRNA (cmo5U34)-methyltransferase
MVTKIQLRLIMNTSTGNFLDRPWQFDQQVAAEFVDHARQHIPNYETVIQKCLILAQQQLTSNSKILDFGCATGHTLSSFYSAGFTNLHGIDLSADMLAQCPSHLTQLHCGGTVPDSHRNFDMIMCNWTLQFSKNKLDILWDIARALRSGGILIISEKISEDPAMIDLYHRWKFDQGVSLLEIDQKARSLQGVMTINSQSWWQDNLNKLGFTQIQIIDASWCFCTYVCVKV